MQMPWTASMSVLDDDGDATVVVVTFEVLGYACDRQ